jgi:cardiolipin synthase
MQSTLGIILDPVADKLTQLTLTLCLSIQYPVLRYLLFLLVIKESFQCIVGLTHLCKGEMLSGALPAGKICTTVFFISLIVLVLIPDLKTEIVTAIAITNGVFLSYAFVRYFFAYFGRNTPMQRLDDKRI